MTDGRDDGAGEASEADDELGFEFSLTDERREADGGAHADDASNPFGGAGSGAEAGDGAATDSTEAARLAGVDAEVDAPTPAPAPGTDADSDADDAVEPVELLVQLAEEGEIEPWDIDVVTVTDAFLDRLDETDLRTSGRALFYASVLLRMKSDALLAPDEEEEAGEAVEPWEAAMEGGGGDPADAPGVDPVDALEAEMDRRLDRKHARGSPETLDELVRELREAERGSWWKESRSYDTTDSPREYGRGTQTLDYHSADDFRRGGEPTESDVTGATHAEDIETTIEAVHTALAEQYDAGRAEVLFAEVRDVAATPVTTYLALLFLSHRGDVSLRQDDLFGDLWIRDPAADPSTEDEESEAVAG